MLQWFVATLHLLTLPLGLGAVWARARALRRTRSPADLASVFTADNLWALAAALWIATGLWRVFAGLEKGSDYYLHARTFHIKMTLFIAIFLLEILPIVTLMRWRIAIRKGAQIDLGRAPTLARISTVQALLAIGIVFAATALARGMFFG